MNVNVEKYIQLRVTQEVATRMGFRHVWRVCQTAITETLLAMSASEIREADTQSKIYIENTPEN